MFIDAIYAALAKNEISRREAIERVLYHPEYGGNRANAESLVENWLTQIGAAEEEWKLSCLI